MTLQYHEIEIEEYSNILEVRVKGKFEKEDYDLFVPEVERMISEQGKIRILLVLKDFHGWTAGALWEDTRFGVKHFNDLEKLAIVGDRKWEKGMGAFCKVFTTGEVRYFDLSGMEEAEKWIGKRE